jgi:ABC-type multidrug transport system fused ATPase/permease subunit
MWQLCGTFACICIAALPSGWHLILITVLQLPILYIGSNHSGKNIVSAQERYNTEELSLMSALDETIAMSLVIKISNLLDATTERFLQLGYACSGAIRAGKVAKGKYSALVVFVHFTNLAVVISLGVVFLSTRVSKDNGGQARQMEIAAFVAMVTSVAGLKGTYQSLAEALAVLDSGAAELESMRKMLAGSLIRGVDTVESDRPTNSHHQSPVPPDDGIRIANLTAHYNKHSCLTDVNLFLPCSKMIAIVGEPGAGKSSLSKVLCGLCSVSSGTIHINGKLMHDSRQLVRRVAYMHQESLLFSSSILENVMLDQSFGESNVFREAAEEA